MASLYAPAISNEQLLAQIKLRHRSINLDYEYISGFPYENINLFSNINWITFDFNKASVDALNDVQGIYMFTFNPYIFSLSNHNADVVLYIGQASKLKERLNKYFYYPNSTKVSDQERRYMILFFSNYLRIHIYETKDWSQEDLDTLEYSLIDSILPPFNQKVHSEFAQAYRKILN
jgi:hypothetical protein